MDLNNSVRSTLFRRIFHSTIAPTSGLAETYGLSPSNVNDVAPTQSIDLDKSNEQVLLEEINASIARLERIAPSGFNLADLVFIPHEEPPSVLPHLEDRSPPDAETFLAGLDPAGTSTQRFKFIVRSLQSLVHDLQLLLSDVKELHPELGNRCEGVLTSVQFELNRLLVAAMETRKVQLSRQKAHIGVGARRIEFSVTPNPATRLSPITTAAIILIATIHCFMNVSRENCNFILRSIRAMLKLVIMGQPQQNYIMNSIERIPVTLETSLHYLGIQPNLNYYVVCPRCATLYPEGEDVPERCTAVDINRRLCGAEMLKLRRRGSSVWMRPRKRYSHQTLEEWLSFFLNRPGIEDLIESARPELQSNCTDFWGASYLHNFPGPGQKSFFEAGPGDLRLAFLIYHDFFNPFTNGIAAKQRSIGNVTMVCLNLPYQVRYNRENIYTAAIIPGPSEPSREQINHYICPIAKNMKEHYYPGVWIARTQKYPNGRHVRSAAMVESMDLLASRSWCGLGPPTHTLLCSFCSITKDDIDNFDHVYPARNMQDHAQHVRLWLDAPDGTTRDLVWKHHAARYSEWLRFPWWSPFLAPVAPMHWTKNILEKQLRENMNWSWSIPTGIPSAPKTSKLITSLELQWGEAALRYYGAIEFKQSRLTEPLLRYLCLKRGIFNAGRNSKYMIKALNAWRTEQGILNNQGDITNLQDQASHSHVLLAKARFYLSRAKDASYLTRKTHVGDLKQLCEDFKLHSNGTHLELATTLVNHNEKFPLPTTAADGLQLTSAVAVLGYEVMTEIQQDIRNTVIPSWVKAPPVNFGTISHGKIGAEEYKSLAMISLTITLVRLWRSSSPEFAQRLDHFLHLVQSVRILSYQSITQHDIDQFSYHYAQYLAHTKELYPFSSIIPTQHLGLHIPYFLATLGPGTRFNENPAEMFIGMLQDIPTNWKFGELEPTIHREIVTACNLQALLIQPDITDAIAQVGETVQEYLDRRYPTHTGIYSNGWVVSHPRTTTLLNDEIYAWLAEFCSLRALNQPTKHQIMCTKLQHGHIIYQPSSASIGNSQILFEAPNTQTWTPGRIEMIAMQSELTGSADPPQLSIFVRPFVLLCERDYPHDPYVSHPIIGASGARMAMILYQRFGPGLPIIIQPKDIICHIATCPYPDTNGTFSEPCYIALSLDLRHVRPE